MASIHERIWINEELEHYGECIVLRKSTLAVLFTVFCLLTPCTNWMLVFIKHLKDIKIRYEFKRGEPVD